MDVQIKHAVLRLNEDIESQLELNPRDLGHVRVPEVLQERFGFPETLSELSIEQCVQIAVIIDADAFQRFKRAKAVLQFRRLKSKGQTKH